MIDTLAGAWSYDFVRTAVIGGALGSIALGVVGALVVAKGEVFLATGIAHASYAGVGLGFFLGLDPTPWVTVAGVVAAVTMGLVRHVARTGTDTLISAMWGVGLSTGVILIDLTPGYTPNALSYLFGSILAIPTETLVFLTICDAVILVAVALWYRPLVGLLADREFAAARGMPVLAFELGLLALVALTVTVLIQVIGVILLIAQLAIPAALASRSARSLRGAMALATAIGAGMVLAGLAVSIAADVTSGPAIVCVSAACFGVATAAGGLRARLRARGTAARGAQRQPA
jgi:zinc transport system permease protein